MNPTANQPSPDFHGAALIDRHGREIPITEAMIQRACERLEQSWHYPADISQREQKAG